MADPPQSKSKKSLRNWQGESATLPHP